MPATITSVERLLNDEASFSNGSETEKITFRVTVQEDNATPYAVRRAVHASIPADNDEHPDNENMVVVTKTARRARGTGPQPRKDLWDIEVTYQTKTWAPSENSDSEGEQDFIELNVTGVEERIYTQNTVDTGSGAQPIRNILGDIMEPVEDTIFDEQIEVSFETTNLNLAKNLSAARNKINSGSVNMNLPQPGGLGPWTKTFATHTLLLKSCDYGAAVSRGNPDEVRWKVKVVLLWREDTWNPKLPEKGYRWVKDGSLTGFKDTAAYLNGSGEKLAPGDPLVYTSPQRIKKETDLGSILGAI